MLADTVGTAIARKADYADLYFEFRISEGFALEEGIVKKATKNISQGVGVRVVAGDKTGYAHTDDVTVDAPAPRLADRAGDRRRRRHAAAGRGARRRAPPTISTPCRTVRSNVALTDKIALLNQIDVAARRHDPRITNVLASLGRRAEDRPGGDVGRASSSATSSRSCA